MFSVFLFQIGFSYIFFSFFEDSVEVLKTQTIGRDFELENQHLS